MTQPATMFFPVSRVPEEIRCYPIGDRPWLWMWKAQHWSHHGRCKGIPSFSQKLKQTFLAWANFEYSTLFGMYVNFGMLDLCGLIPPLSLSELSEMAWPISVIVKGLPGEKQSKIYFDLYKLISVELKLALLSFDPDPWPKYEKMMLDYGFTWHEMEHVLNITHYFKCEFAAFCVKTCGWRS